MFTPMKRYVDPGFLGFPWGWHIAVLPLKSISAHRAYVQ